MGNLYIAVSPVSTWWEGGGSRGGKPLPQAPEGKPLFSYISLTGGEGSSLPWLSMSAGTQESAVMMYELGKLADESMDSFIVELRKVLISCVLSSTERQC